MDIPVRCVRCGLQTTTPNLIGGDNATNMTLQNVTLKNACPHCGDDMKAIDGTYDFVGGVMTAFRALGVEQLRGIEAVLKDARSGQIGTAEAAAQVSAIAPSVGAFMQGLQRQPQWTPPVIVNTLLAVVAVVLAYMALHQNALTEGDHEALQHDIREVIEQVQPTPLSQPYLPPGTTIITPPTSPPRAASPAKPQRKKRPPKQFGRNKLRKRRH